MPPAALLVQSELESKVNEAESVSHVVFLLFSCRKRNGEGEEQEDMMEAQDVEEQEKEMVKEKSRIEERESNGQNKEVEDRGGEGKEEEQHQRKEE